MVNRRSNSNSAGNKSDEKQVYEQIMGEEGGHQALSSRLVSFRKWVQNAGCKVHPAVCIVNGEATDGTRNAPVLILGTSASSNPSKPLATAEGRCGLVDTDEDRVMYDRTIGCQVRTAREMKEGQVLMTVPKSVMIHPDLIAASDAGRAALACIEPMGPGANFWDAFAHTGEKEKAFLDKTTSSGGNHKGTQLLVKILQERKKVESALAKAAKAVEEGNTDYKLAAKGSISSRAAVLLFLIQQRFTDDLDPTVSSTYDFGQCSNKDDATTLVERIEAAPGTPSTFSPYARTLPPSVALPMCWKRNELAVLASCIPGLAALQEVAAQILTFSSDLIALVEAGIFHRFPSLFSQKQLTWDRWLWAASVHTSRLLPASCYLNKDEEKAADHVVAPDERFYSPPQVWDDLGVMVPLIDMLNHEMEESQIKWESSTPPPSGEDAEMLEEDGDKDAVAKVVIQKRVKKGAQIYTTYGFSSNQHLMLSYGFCQMSNDADTIPLGWALNDGVGKIPKPLDFKPVGQAEGEEDLRGFIFESSDKVAVNAWWNEDRMAVLKHEIKSDPSFWESLRSGMRMTSSALSNGTYQPILLSAMVVATMSPWAIKQHKEKISSSDSEVTHITMTKRHQVVLRNYMLFFFNRKLERLLQNFSSGLKAHFNILNLWTKASEGGLDYTGSEGMDSSEHASNFIGWNSFFDTYAYNAAMEVESRYYSLAPDSCVLTLYDGNLRALQKSIDGASSESAFKETVCKQLDELGFIISLEDNEEELEEEVVLIEGENDSADIKVQKEDTQVPEKDAPLKKEEEGKQENTGNGGNGNGEKKERKRNRQRNRNKQGGPPAIKLHIGNLSYQTVPSRMFDFFAMRYGRENILECHIPTERETGKSRGFGFVTLTEGVALRVMNENLPHEIDGRVVKLAESNTSVQARSTQSGPPMSATSDRCSTCGYRPRYCTCQKPNMSGFQHGGMHGGPMPMMGGPPPGHMYPPDDIYGPGPRPGHGPMHGDMDRFDQGRGRGGMHNDDNRGGRGGVRSRSMNRARSYSRSPSPRYRRRVDSRERDYDRRNRDRRGRSQSRSRSRSRDRRDRRDRDWDSRRSSRRSRGSSRRSSRYSRSRSRSLSRSRSRSRSSSRRDRDRERKSSGSGANGENANSQSRGDRNRSRSQSIPAPQDRGSEIDSNKREGGKSSRRTRSKSRDRNPRSRKRSSKGSRRSKDASKRHSRSRSF